MERPKVILLDAVGTLFGVKGSVGEVYSQIAKEFEVEVSAQILNTTFVQSFKAAPPATFPNADLHDIPQQEFEWWRKIAFNTFKSAGVLPQFSDFPGFFSELYIHFGTAEPWFIYPDVVSSLIDWQQQGIELGIVSNFDSRIFSVLESLELSSYFTSITISTQARVTKPDPTIFAIALEKHNCPSTAAWHIGDSIVDDYQGAKAAGLRGIWINRQTLEI
ncbi:HAD-IA family hydrolase [Nodularia spumigena]|uniref:HAD-IA family hydrolase n=1 Tax=Nodularia spumigena TaxID=70799 RepID=UPI00233125ED|nr:HAD family hydrolase [Nodularia spumigena]MDB9317437.1 HAD family hydrolase [Nodularia spumigena CS-590/01A]MDB9321678.1 HAD family hydrolase [Nodularia spumigena CS-591/07A]MDB9325761.1 HAD family hydrolase [Nodularia spumigena CS-590/02]MDB9329701.1 HAD family hydrolase [Nodularia spumigena CS-591/04]MDB9335845.1 HAD family hydrolase [Nodularia spumigena CS-590/01]